METLGEDNNGLKPFTPPVPPRIVPEIRAGAPNIVVAPHGYYVVSYKMSDEINRIGRKKNYYAVTTHTNIERFINEELEFGTRTYDVKIIEKADNYLDALSVADILRTEENFDEHPSFRLGGILKARYTFREIFFGKDTKLKKYPL